MQHAPDRFWRSFAELIDHAPKEDRDRLIKFTGLENLYHARRSGRGTILLTYHGPVTPIASRVLARYLGLGRIPTLSQVRSDHMAEQETAEDPEQFNQRTSGWSATFALQGQRLLQQSGIVQMVNDVSYADGRFLAKTIGRRVYDLKPGFAELALASGAAVLPAYSGYDAAGCLQMTLLPELKPLADRVDHAARLEQMIDQYVTFLENTWRMMPQSVGWGALQRYASRPLP